MLEIHSACFVHLLGLKDVVSFPGLSFSGVLKVCSDLSGVCSLYGAHKRVAHASDGILDDFGISEF